MTINKSEGQSLHTVGIDLHIPVVSHGQLYVALLRATASHMLYLLRYMSFDLFVIIVLIH